MSENEDGSPLRRESPFIDAKDLDKGLPKIPYLFDSVGALITDRDSIDAILQTVENSIPIEVKEFILAHSTEYPDNKSLIAMRNSEYFKLTTQIDTHDRKLETKTIYDELNNITALCMKMHECLGSEEISTEQKLALLCLLDYGKGISLKILDNEFLASRHNLTKNYTPAMQLAQTYVDAYYAILLGKSAPLAPLSAETVALDREGLSQPTEKGRLVYADWVREMDNPLLISFQVNRICNELQRGTPCEVVLTPFQGASEIGLALISRIKMIGTLPVPELVPIKYGGSQARSNRPPEQLFIQGFSPRDKLRDKHVWIVDDNIVTGNTQVRLSKFISENFQPADIRASVVQVSDGEIKEDLEPQLKKLLATRAVSATFAVYAVPEDDIDLYRFSLPLDSAALPLQQRAFGAD